MTLVSTSVMFLHQNTDEIAGFLADEIERLTFFGFSTLEGETHDIVQFFSVTLRSRWLVRCTYALIMCPGN
ncbi:hypothetical protein J6590_064334 [Homalodisca vitripennis]|nr:hypothetical protein J6590_064334 [Homalodisca vitripennis]